MVLGLLTLVIMGIAAYAFWREGPLTAFVMACNVLLAGILAYNFFEPVADLLEPSFQGTFLAGTEDALALMLVFCPALMVLRWATNSLASTHMEYPPVLYRGGAVVFGLLAGYFVAGFLTCLLMTMPIQRDFLGYEPYVARDSSPLRRWFPPDFVWLATMHRLSGGVLTAGEEDAGRPRRFDPQGNFVWRYGRYRRLDDGGGVPKVRYDLQP